jgi:hypothetical protein
VVHKLGTSANIDVVHLAKGGWVFCAFLYTSNLQQEVSSLSSHVIDDRKWYRTVQEFWSSEPDSTTIDIQLFCFGRCLDLSPIFSTVPFMIDPPSTTQFDMDCMAVLPERFGTRRHVRSKHSWWVLEVPGLMFCSPFRLLSKPGEVGY